MAYIDQCIVASFIDLHTVCISSCTSGILSFRLAGRPLCLEASSDVGLWPLAAESVHTLDLITH